MKIILTASAAAMLLAGCVVSSGKATTKDYSLDGFDEVHASAGVNVVLKQGPFSIKAEGPEAIVDKLEIKVEGGELHIGRKSSFLGSWTMSTEKTLVTVSAPTYGRVSASSGADIDGEGLQLADLKLDASSGADLKLSGSCKRIEAEASSGADIDVEDLRCETATAQASSGADIVLFASVSARGDASSGGDITVRGNPGEFDKDESSGGDVTKAP